MSNPERETHAAVRGEVLSHIPEDHITAAIRERLADDPVSILERQAKQQRQGRPKPELDELTKLLDQQAAQMIVDAVCATARRQQDPANWEIFLEQMYSGSDATRYRTAIAALNILSSMASAREAETPSVKPPFSL